MGNIEGITTLLIPIHLPGHWICCSIQIEQKEIFTFDSLHLTRKETEVVKLWTEQNFRGTWKIKNQEKLLQSDATSCGVFVCAFIESIVEGLQLNSFFILFFN